MASNQYVNKVVYDNNTLIDITDTTAVESDVAEGKTFYKADGNKAVGTNTGGSFEIKNASALFYYGARLDEYSKYMNAINQNENTLTSYMFTGCSGLTSLDLSNFDTSNVEDMKYMFQKCSDLTSLDLSNFNTSNVINTRNMFTGCSGLTSLDLSSFDTSNVEEMTSMFSSCSGLTSLDLSNFDTSNVKGIGSMFYNSPSLTSLDLSNFDLSNVTVIGGMFNSCSSLTSLVLGTNNTSYSKVTNSTSLFQNCINLASITIRGTTVLPLTNSSALTNLKADCQIKVPANLVNAYKSATNWSTRANYISAI